METNRMRKENEIINSAINLAKTPSWFGDDGIFWFDSIDDFNYFAFVLSCKTSYKASNIKTVLKKCKKFKIY